MCAVALARPYMGKQQCPELKHAQGPDCVSTEQELIAESIGAPGQPRLIFFCDLAGQALLDLLCWPGLLDRLVSQGYSVALSVARLDAARARAARLLNRHGVPLVAWLLLPPEAGFAF